MTTPRRVFDESHPVRRSIRLAPLKKDPDQISKVSDRRRRTVASWPPATPIPSTPSDGPIDEWVDDMDGDWDAVHP